MNEDLDSLRHSTAHLLAAAVIKLWPSSLRAIGPSIPDGFYYDFEFEKPISDEDLPKIEQEMRSILTTWKNFSSEEVSKDEAKKAFSGNPYKEELIDEIVSKGEKITLYNSGNYIDLCRGGHVNNASDISNFKLLSIAGAYWRGDEKNKMLTRIYGTTFFTKEELEEFLKIKEEAKKRDHRKIASELDLYTVSELVGPGLPLWTPKGTILRDILDDFVWQLRRKDDYSRVDIPHITKKSLYEKSGHWEKFGDELFQIESREGHTFVLKPMNCPHHIEIFNRKMNSYRDMPIRYANTTKVYRDEQTGELAGFARVRSITQDDAHVFCRFNQIEEEMKKVIDIVHSFYSKLELPLTPTLSLRDPEKSDKFLGDDKTWDIAENALRNIVSNFEKGAEEVIGEAAFYGPKIDFISKDSLGRKWQVATIQLDMNLPERFDLSCRNEKGENERIVIIHAAIMGSIERFLASYIEHTGGNFPTWLSPVQVKILPIAEAHKTYGKEIYQTLKNANIRCELDDSDETLNKKIRNAKVEKVPYFLVLGDAEIDENMVKAEERSGEYSEKLTIEDFIERIRAEN